jgi:hypothetical protein
MRARRLAARSPLLVRDIDRDFFCALRGKVLTALQLAGGDLGSAGQNIESQALARKILRNKKLTAQFSLWPARLGICFGLSGMRPHIDCVLSVSSVKVVRHKNGNYLGRGCGKTKKGSRWARLVA